MSGLTFAATGDSIRTQRPRPHRDAAFTSQKIMAPRELWIGASEHGGGHQAPPFILDEVKRYGFTLRSVGQGGPAQATAAPRAPRLAAPLAAREILAGPVGAVRAV